MLAIWNVLNREPAGTDSCFCALQALYESVKARDPDQKEFLQAVEEVRTCGNRRATPNR